MENFNKVLSFVLGLVVVVVFVIVLSGRLNLRSGIFSDNKKTTVSVTPSPSPSPKEDKNGFFSRLFSRKPTPTPSRPTPTRAIQPSPTPAPLVVTQNGQTKGGVTGVKEIPATGAPSLLLPLFGSSALLGFYLRRRK